MVPSARRFPTTVVAGVVALGVAAAAVILPGTAQAFPQAATVQIKILGSGATWVDYDNDWRGVSSHLVVWMTSTGGVVFDDTSAMIAGFGCSYVAPPAQTTVRCEAPAPLPDPEGLTADLGFGNDYLEVSGRVPFTIWTKIAGGQGNDTLLGGPEGDGLRGGPGDDHLEGRGGDDGMVGGAGADVMLGGTGVDSVSYPDKTNAIVASLDGAAGNDGEPGEGDTIGADVESLSGGDGDDTLIGNEADNYLYGCMGQDALYGLAGNDQLAGEADSPPYGVASPPGPAWGNCVVITSLAADLLVGGAGVDTVTYAWHEDPVVADLDGDIGDDGTAGEGDTIIDVEGLVGGEDDDLLVGNDGPNQLNGQGGNDSMYGLADADTLVGFLGDDHLYGGDGADVLFGDDGTDECDVGAGGFLAYGCEV
jgi:Ca2+-binding RTX toxin-like protein